MTYFRFPRPIRWFAALSLLLSVLGSCQSTTSVTTPLGTETLSEPKDPAYITVPGDPMQTRIYTLENGLTVYLSRNTKAPQVSGIMGVRAGSTYDPADATGLAHYLEHMLFKGTDKLGSRDYAAEAPLLEAIAAGFEQYRQTEDSTQRLRLYARIDSLSQAAAHLAVANAYDQTLGALGASGANAFTSNELTAYFSTFPSNKLDPWLKLEAERFRHPVMRLFHTELEAVYEEKNISLDDEDDQVAEQLDAALFPTHPYGQQTVIGTIEHLKNPSIRAIEAYYKRYYVPANMVLCLAGDLEYDETIALVRQYWQVLPTAEAPAPPDFAPESPMTTSIEKEVLGPGPETLTLAFRLPGVNHPDYPVFQMIDLLLSNGGSGLIDLELLQRQRIQSGYAQLEPLIAYSKHELGGEPRQGQTLEEVKDLLLAQIARLGRGEFETSRLEGVVNNALVGELQENEDNFSRALKCLTAFAYRMDYASQVVYSLDRVRKVSRADIMRVVKAYYTSNYAVVYKRTGAAPNTTKVSKPPITPLPVLAAQRSPWEDSLLETPVPALSPVFVDFEADIRISDAEPGIPFWYVQNTDNELFSYHWVWDVGKDAQLNLGLLDAYLTYLGAEDLSAAALQEAWARQGTQVRFDVGRRQTTLSVSGLQRYEAEALALVQQWLTAPAADTAALRSLKADIMQNRATARQNPSRIRSHLQFYGLYGAQNPRKHILPADSLAKVDHAALMEALQGLRQTQHKVLYFGPTAAEAAEAQARNIGLGLAPYQAPSNKSVFWYQSPDTPTVYVVDYEMVQTMVFWLSPLGPYTPPRGLRMDLYNEYLDGGAGSLMFQQIREARALAYATYAEALEPYSPEMGYFRMALIGTQQDKLAEALPAVHQLLDSMPLTEANFELSRQSLLLNLQAERIQGEDLLFAYEEALRYAEGADKRKPLYQYLQETDLADFSQFYRDEIQGRPTTILVMGQLEKLDKKVLSRYGRIVELSLDDLFGE